MGEGMKSILMTNVLAAQRTKTVSRWLVMVFLVEKLTEMRQHAPKDSKCRRGLLVKPPEGGARKLLQVLGELERGSLAD